MAQAPEPRYSASGRQMGDWAVRVHYDSVRDDLIVSWSQTSTPHMRGRQGTRRFAGDEMEEALAEAEYRGRVMGVARLF